MTEALSLVELYSSHGLDAYRTLTRGPSLSSLPRPPSKRSVKGMTVAGPPTANAENDISLTEELWMEDEPTEDEEKERRDRITALLKDNPRPASHAAVAKTFEVRAYKSRSDKLVPSNI